jgi:hypothetical protein
VQDQYGNATVSADERQIDLASTSSTGQFAASPDGPWGKDAPKLRVGDSCINIYYRDSQPGSYNLTLSSEGLTPVSQGVSIIAQPPAEEPATPPAAAVLPQTITVYSEDPTLPSSVPSSSPTVQIALPTVEFPVITSPAQDTIVAPISDDIIVSGIAPPSTAITIKANDGKDTLAATTSDKTGNWIVHIPRQLFKGQKQTIFAQISGKDIVSQKVTFTIKAETVVERLVRWWSQ